MSIKFFGLVLGLCSIGLVRGGEAARGGEAKRDKPFVMKYGRGHGFTIYCSDALVSTTPNQYIKEATNNCTIIFDPYTNPKPKSASLGSPGTACKKFGSKP